MISERVGLEDTGEREEDGNGLLRQKMGRGGRYVLQLPGICRLYVIGTSAAQYSPASGHFGCLGHMAIDAEKDEKVINRGAW